MPSETITIPNEEYEELIETLEVLMDQGLLGRITISLQEFSPRLINNREALTQTNLLRQYKIIIP